MHESEVFSAPRTYTYIRTVEDLAATATVNYRRRCRCSGCVDDAYHEQNSCTCSMRS